MLIGAPDSACSMAGVKTAVRSSVAEALQRGQPTAAGARNHGRFRTAAQLGVIGEFGGIRCGDAGSHVVEHAELALFGAIEQHVAAPGHARHVGLNDIERRRRRDGGIDRIAALLENPHPRRPTPGDAPRRPFPAAPSPPADMRFHDLAMSLL